MIFYRVQHNVFVKIAVLLLAGAAVFSFLPYNLNRLLIKPLVVPPPLGVYVPPTEIGIVLGAGLLPDGRLSDIGQERADAAVSLTQNNPIPLLFTGGETPYGIESEVMLAYAQERGYGGQGLLERRATSTYENAKFSEDILKQLPFAHDVVGVITSPYHSRRALSIFRKLMPERRVYVHYPTDSVVLEDSIIGRWKGLYNITREYTANVWYAVRYR